MTPIIMRPYRAEDYRKITPKEPGTIPMPSRFMGPVRTGVANGYPLFILGFQIPWPGFAEAWAVFDQAVDQFPNTWRVFRNCFELIVADSGLRRVQAHVDPNFAESVRIVQHLGFELEGVLRHWFPDGRTAHLYGRVR